MENLMENILEKIESYELFINIIPGAIYIVFFEYITSFKIQDDRIFINIIFYYFIGVLIGRIGSLFIDKLIRLYPYEEYIKAEKKDEKIEKLSTIANMYRSFASVSFCVLVTTIFAFFFPTYDLRESSNLIWIGAFSIITTAIFLISYKKQIGYVADRINISKDPSN